MGLARGQRPHPRAIIFDLDRCLIDSRNAWQFCVEESLSVVLDRRLSAKALVEEYHTRPWRDAMGILVESAEEAVRCAQLCNTMYARSAMKKLLVHEGISMALDHLRGEQIELGAISRLPHGIAVKQVQSTGLDRFIAVLSATQPDAPWQPGARAAECLAFLEASAGNSAFMSGDSHDRARLAADGLAVFDAGWAPGDAHGEGAITAPSGMLEVVLRAWTRHVT